MHLQQCGMRCVMLVVPASASYFMFYFFNSLSTVHSSELSALPTALLLLLTLTPRYSIGCQNQKRMILPLLMMQTQALFPLLLQNWWETSRKRMTRTMYQSQEGLRLRGGPRNHGSGDTSSPQHVEKRNIVFACYVPKMSSMGNPAQQVC